MLEVGVGLALGHRAPRPLARTGAARARPPSPNPPISADAARSLSSRSSWWRLDRLRPPGEVVERDGRGRAARSSRLRARSFGRATSKNCASGSSDVPMPEMCGVIVGSTWSPDSSTPSAGSNRHRWSAVWPGVCIATHSRPASVTTSASSTSAWVWAQGRACGCASPRTAFAGPGRACTRRRPTAVERQGFGAAARRAGSRPRSGPTRCGTARG